MLRRHAIRTLRLTRPSSFTARPSPPRLPDDQQSEFERLQRSAAVSSAFQPTPASTSSNTSPVSTDAGSTTTDTTSRTEESSAAASQNQGLFRGAPPEFEGDTNPRTGEVGGPKNEPLRWGGAGDWSYNGRVTDF